MKDKSLNRDSKRKNPKVILVICFLSLSLPLISENIQYLKKIGEIKDGFSTEKENFFIKITGLCCDDEGNLYVADSGWNKIFKFDSNGKFIMSFGRQGQGPGEFMAQRLSHHLRISFGNDGKLYVMDPGNQRLSLFSKDGKFIKSFKVPHLTNDAPVVNSNGDIYLLSQSGIKVIDCYDLNFKYKESILDMESHLRFPYGKPYSKFYNYRSLNEIDIQKLINEKDYLMLISNFALSVFIFDSNNKKINEFEVDEREFREDFEKNLEQHRKMVKYLSKKIKKKPQGFEQSALISPFLAFLCRKRDLCLYYKRSDGIPVIYNYNMDGTMRYIWKFHESIEDWPWYITANDKYIFIPTKSRTILQIYIIK